MPFVIWPTTFAKRTSVSWSRSASLQSWSQHPSASGPVRALRCCAFSQINRTPSSLPIRGLQIAVNSQYKAACLAAIRQSEKPQVDRLHNAEDAATVCSPSSTSVRRQWAGWWSSHRRKQHTGVDADYRRAVCLRFRCSARRTSICSAVNAAARGVASMGFLSAALIPYIESL